MRSSPRRKQYSRRPEGHCPRPKERGQRRRGSTDCTAATAMRQADRHEEHRACPPRSTRTRSRTGRTGRSDRTGARSLRDNRAAAAPPTAGEASRQHGRTARSRCTLIPVSIPMVVLTIVLTEQGRKCAVEVGGQSLRPGRSGVRPNHHRRTGRQCADPIAGDVPQLPLHPITDDRVPNRLGYDEAHSGRCLGSGTTQVDDERSATGATSPTHCGSEVAAVAHSVSC